MAPSYTAGQRTSISQFVSFTQSKESIAAKVRVITMEVFTGEAHLPPEPGPCHLHLRLYRAPGEARATVDCCFLAP